MKEPKKCEECGIDLFNRRPNARFCKGCAEERRYHWMKYGTPIAG